MKKEAVLTWDEIERVGVGALVVSAVGGVIAYFRSIANKIDKSDFEQRLKEMRSEFDKELEAINRRHSLWETRSERFATREMVDALNGKLERLETRLDTNFEKLNNRLDKLIESSAKE